MLVIYTLNGTVSGMLPQTALLKFIDVWIGFGLFLFLHLIILILLILIEHMPSQDKEGSLFVESASGPRTATHSSMKSKTETFARLILPIIETTFVLLYFVTGFLISYKNM